MSSIASVRILVAISDWCASLKVVSVTFTGFAKLRPSFKDYETRLGEYFKVAFSVQRILIQSLWRSLVHCPKRKYELCNRFSGRFYGKIESWSRKSGGAGGESGEENDFRQTFKNKHATNSFLYLASKG
jgi:hypothetical protein